MGLAEGCARLSVCVLSRIGLTGDTDKSGNHDLVLRSRDMGRWNTLTHSNRNRNIAEASETTRIADVESGSVIREELDNNEGESQGALSVGEDVSLGCRSRGGWWDSSVRREVQDTQHRRTSVAGMFIDGHSGGRVVGDVFDAIFLSASV
ncbi:hypothetical protein Tco_0743555 [Tanacetum coccineum]